MERPMKKAENIDMNDTCFNVRGVDKMMPIIVMITLKTTVHCEWSDSVLRILAPVKTWKPMSMMLFRSNMIPANSYATLLLPQAK